MGADDVTEGTEGHQAAEDVFPASHAQEQLFFVQETLDDRLTSLPLWVHPRAGAAAGRR